MQPSSFDDRYQIVEEIGRGGAAIVYLAHDLRVERDVALKVLPTQFTHDPRFFEYFEREARALSRLEHNAIVPVYDYGVNGDWPYLVMRLMKGGSLADRLDGRPLSLNQTLNITTRVCAALDAAHALGLIHRDVKPGNILFDGESYPYLADFGIVRLADTSHTVTLIGTPEYMTPEQIRDDPIDHRLDIYQMGIVLYQMLSGTLPFSASSTAALLQKHAFEPPPPLLERNRDLPPATLAVVEKALAKKTSDRYASAGELAEALRRALQPVPASATPPAEQAPALAPERGTKEPERASLERPTATREAKPADKKAAAGMTNAAALRLWLLLSVGATLLFLGLSYLLPHSSFSGSLVANVTRALVLSTVGVLAMRLRKPRS